MFSSKVWLITGASSGLGRAMTEHVLKSGDIAVATLRTPSALDALVAQYKPTQLLVLQLDVSQSTAIANAFNKAVETFGRIDTVFNNAGYGVLGELEGTPEDTALALFDVNFWGAANVSREAVRVFREVNKPVGGHLFQVSSISGIRGTGSTGFYNASKFALEGFSESLAMELNPAWNIKLVILATGAFRTKGFNSTLRLPVHPAYKLLPQDASDPTFVPSRSFFEDTTPVLRGDPHKAAEMVYRIYAMRDPPLHFPLGVDSVGVLKAKADVLANSADTYASWTPALDADE